MQTHSLEPLLNPASIAIIGASDKPGRVGGMPIAHLCKFGYSGGVYPINPKYQEVFGLRCWPEVESLPDTPDLAVLAISAHQVVPMLRRCAAKGVRAAIVYAAGFAEAGREGAAMQEELREYVEQTDMVVAGPNAMGFANLNSQAHTNFASVFNTAPMQSGAGSVSLLTQSGNVSAAVYATARRLGVELSHFINTGNEACVDFSKYLEYLAQDDATEVVIGYVEELRRGAHFMTAATELARRGKMLILYKAGETDKGSEAVRSHTSALAGDRAIYRAAFQQLNIIQGHDFMQMAQLARLAGYRNRSAGKRVAIVTMSGALGAILADKLIAAGVELPTLPSALQEILRAGIPDYGMVSNPVDVTGNIVNDPGFVRTAMQSLAQAQSVDTVIIYAPGYLLDRMADDLLAVVAETSKLFVAIDTGSASSREQLRAGDVPVFEDIGEAVSALAPFLLWHERRKMNPWLPPQELQSEPQHLPLQYHDEYHMKQLLAEHGMPVAAEHLAKTADDAVAAAESLGYPVAVKILSADVAHKTEAGGVQLDLCDSDDVRRAYHQVLANVGDYAPNAAITGVVVSKMESGVAEIIMGISRDPVFGMTLTVGLGGVLTEVYQDASHRILPVDESIAREMLHELKALPLLTGFRGRPKADIDAACSAIAAFSRAGLALANQFSVLEVNPLLVGKQGDGVRALDALAVPDSN